MTAIKAELRKLLTVRSTYLLTGLVWAIVAFVSFYAVGYHSSAIGLADPKLVQNVVFGLMQLIGLIASIISVLLLAHEYRYNTINYTLTISNSRSKVLGSKFLVLSFYAVFLCLTSVALTIGLIHAGAAAHDHSLAAQTYSLKDVLWRAVYFVWGNAMAALIITTLIRNLVGSIVALFVIPTLEQLSGLLLKNNIGYLPFTALDSITMQNDNSFSVNKSAIIFAVYLAIFAIVAWVVFLRRDAN